MRSPRWPSVRLTCRQGCGSRAAIALSRSHAERTGQAVTGQRNASLADSSNCPGPPGSQDSGGGQAKRRCCRPRGGLSAVARSLLEARERAPQDGFPSSGRSGCRMRARVCATERRCALAAHTLSLVLGETQARKHAADHSPPAVESGVPWRPKTKSLWPSNRQVVAPQDPKAKSAQGPLAASTRAADERTHSIRRTHTRAIMACVATRPSVGSLDRRRPRRARVSPRGRSRCGPSTAGSPARYSASLPLTRGQQLAPAPPSAQIAPRRQCAGWLRQRNRQRRPGLASRGRLAALDRGRGGARTGPQRALRGRRGTDSQPWQAARATCPAPLAARATALPKPRQLQ